MDEYINLTSNLELLDAELSVSQSTLETWMQEDFSDTAICPHLSDYCDTCFSYQISLNSLSQQIIMHKVMQCSTIHTPLYSNLIP